MKHILKLGITLALFASVSCFCLALVNHITAPVIEQRQADKASSGMKTVFAHADSFEETTDFKASAVQAISIDKMYLAKKGGSVIGAVAQVTGPTYDRSTIIFGIKKDGVLTGMQFLSSSDTAGFGLKASDPNYTVSSGKTFYGQFEGKNANDGFVPGQTFEAVSGATITSKGVAELLTQGSQSALACLAAK